MRSKLLKPLQICIYISTVYLLYRLAADLCVLVLVLGDPPHVVGVVPRTNEVGKLLIVSDDHQLKVLLVLSARHDGLQSLSEGGRVLTEQQPLQGGREKEKEGTKGSACDI